MNPTNRGRFAPLLALVFVLFALGMPVPATAAPGEAPPLGPHTEELLRIHSLAGADGQDRAVLFHGTQVRLLPDGRVERRERIVQRLFSDLAIAHHGDPRVAYDTTRQELEIHSCRTFMLDGTEVPHLPRALNRVTPERVSSCPDRCGLQEMVISLLGLELGCLTELDYTVRDRVPFRPWLEALERIGDFDPVLRRTVVVETPEGVALMAHVRGLERSAEPAASAGETTSRTWTFGPLPGYPAEGGLPDLERTPALLYSTCPSWSDLGVWVDRRLREAALADSALRLWTADGMAGPHSPLDDTDRMARLATVTGERTSPAEDTPLRWWLPVRPAGRTFDSSCGNLLDRAALALAILQEWNIPAGVCLRPAVSHVVREVPCLAQFDDVWLKSPTRSLSLAQGHASASLDPGWATEILVLDPQRSEFAALAPRRGSAFISARIREEADGSVAGEVLCRMGGTLRNQALDLDEFTSELASRLARDGKPGGFRTEILGPDTLSLVLSFTGTALGESLGYGRMRYELPSGPGMPAAAFPEGLNWRRVHRTGSVVLPGRIFESVAIRLELSPGTRPLILLPELKLDTAGAALEQSCDRDGLVLRLRRVLRIDAREIEPSQYGGLREILLHRLEPGSGTILLERPGGQVKVAERTSK